MKLTRWYTEFIFKKKQQQIVFGKCGISISLTTTKNGHCILTLGSTRLTKNWAEKGLHAGGKAPKDKSIKLLKEWDNRLNNLKHSLRYSRLNVNVHGFNKEHK